LFCRATCDLLFMVLYYPVVVMDSLTLLSAYCSPTTSNLLAKSCLKPRSVLR
jgi:hypothetical protein